MLSETLKVLNMIGPFLKKMSHSLIIPKTKKLVFRIKNRNPPLNEIQARQIAYSVLAGTIEYAIAFRNINSKHSFIAVQRTDRDDTDYEQRIHIIEQVGETFAQIWQSDIKYGISNLHVVDLDKDGVHELSFLQKEGGTAAETHTLYLYSMKMKKLLYISEFHRWDYASGPIAPQIRTSPEQNEKLFELFEKYATQFGFLQSKVVDFNNPAFAVEQWHAANGKVKKGSIQLRLYQGKPLCIIAHLFRKSDNLMAKKTAGW